VEFKDDFVVFAEKYDSVQEKDHDLFKEGDRGSRKYDFQWKQC
jgi:hypothetical protein